MGKNMYSGFSRQRVVAKAYEVTTIEFFDTSPNYFRVMNHGTGKLYFSANRIPTLAGYDFTCEADNVKLFTEPHGRDKLYIYNPTGSDCAVDVMSFYAEFDPIALAFSGLTLDLSGASVESSNVIGSFTCSLPAGTNKIGTVSVDNSKDYTIVLNNILSALNTISSKLTDGEGVSY